MKKLGIVFLAILLFALAFFIPLKLSFYYDSLPPNGGREFLFVMYGLFSCAACIIIGIYLIVNICKEYENQKKK